MNVDKVMPSTQNVMHIMVSGDEKKLIEKQFPQYKVHNNKQEILFMGDIVPFILYNLEFEKQIETTIPIMQDASLKDALTRSTTNI